MQVQNFYNIGSIINLVFIIGAMLGGLLVFKKAVIKATTEIQLQTSQAQANAINAMKEEIETLKSRIDSLKGQNKKQEAILKTIYAALKIRGIIIQVDDEIVIIKDDKGGSEIAHIQEAL